MKLGWTSTFWVHQCEGRTELLRQGLLSPSGATQSGATQSGATQSVRGYSVRGYSVRGYLVKGVRKEASQGDGMSTHCP